MEGLKCVAVVFAVRVGLGGLGWSLAGASAVCAGGCVVQLGDHHVLISVAPL